MEIDFINILVYINGGYFPGDLLYEAFVSLPQWKTELKSERVPLFSWLEETDQW